MGEWCVLTKFSLETCVMVSPTLNKIKETKELGGSATTKQSNEIDKSCTIQA